MSPSTFFDTQAIINRNHGHGSVGDGLLSPRHPCLPHLTLRNRSPSSRPTLSHCPPACLDMTAAAAALPRLGILKLQLSWLALLAVVFFPLQLPLVSRVVPYLHLSVLQQRVYLAFTIRCHCTQEWFSKLPMASVPKWSFGALASKSAMRDKLQRRPRLPWTPSRFNVQSE